MVVLSNRKENKYYMGHVNVFNNLREPLRKEEIYTLSLTGLLPMNKCK